ncbi:MAG: hypothetical protein IJ122_06195 [Methanobrevibacter sp.]|nr:hypothetical protein [Methanobrevibacter sp.]
MIFTAREVSNEAVKVLVSLNLNNEEFEKVKYLIRNSVGFLHRISREDEQESTFIAQCNYVICDAEKQTDNKELAIAADCLKIAALKFIKEKNQQLTTILEEQQ